ncbi:MAG: hypothetical protein ACT4OH_07625 [Methylophilaceae bacterium]
MKTVLTFLWDLVYFLSGEGTWGLKAHEALVLEAAISTFPEHLQRQLRSQLGERIFVIRANRHVSHLRISAPSIEGQELQHSLLIVNLGIEGKREAAHVEFYRGRINTVQFRHRAKVYAGKAIQVLDVKPGNPNLSHAAALDRLEHGNNP